MSAPEYYSMLQGILNKLDVYQSLVIDLKTLRLYRQDVTLSGPDSSLLTQLRRQILTGDPVPSLTST